MAFLKCLEGVTDFEKSQQILKNKNLVVKPYDTNGIYLIKYDKTKCNMTDPDVRKCRSLVLEIGTNNIVCVSPFKSDCLDYFTDIYKNNPGDIVYEEFVDGTMINLFKYNGTYYISTRSNLGANRRGQSSSGAPADGAGERDSRS